MGMIYFKELVRGMVGLASPKSVRRVHRLEVQVRIDVAILSPKICRASQPAGQPSRLSMLQSEGRILLLAKPSFCS